MSYFSKFPIMQYPTGLNSSSLRFVYVRNLLRRIALTETVKNESSVFVSYDIKDGEKPEHIAERVYGSPTFHWIVLLCNEIMDPYHDWYKSQTALDAYINRKHKGYRVYFTKTDDTFLYNSDLYSGATLTQGSISDSVVQYDPQYCRIHVSSNGFTAGNAVLTTANNEQTVKIHRVDVGVYSLNHFEAEKGSTADYGANNSVNLDPFSYQTNVFDSLKGSVGLSETPFPTGTDGINYSGAGVVSLWETYIGRYMGISGGEINQYAVSNYAHENNVNNSKRTIRVLHPRFKKQAVKELDSLLGAKL